MTNETLRAALEEIVSLNPAKECRDEFVMAFAYSKSYDIARAALAATAPTADGKDLHDTIMNLPVGNTLESLRHDPMQCLAYKLGHRDARHAAAELVLAAPTAQAIPPIPAAPEQKPTDDDISLAVYMYGYAKGKEHAKVAQQAAQEPMQAHEDFAMQSALDKWNAQQAAPEQYVQDIMFEVYEYATIRDGIDDALGATRDEQRKAMAAQAEKIRAMILAAPSPQQRDATQQAIPAGWKLVPVVPTATMLEAGRCADDGYNGLFAIYKDMIAAAPQPPVAQQEDAKDARTIIDACWMILANRMPADKELAALEAAIAAAQKEQS